MLLALIVVLCLLTHAFAFTCGLYLRARPPSVTWDEVTTGADIDFGPRTIGPLANDFDPHWGQL